MPFVVVGLRKLEAFAEASAGVDHMLEVASTEVQHMRSLVVDLRQSEVEATMPCLVVDFMGPLK